MSTFQGITIQKYIDNWNASAFHPIDPPQTITGLGSITSQMLSLSDSDRVECVHGYPPYATNYGAAKILTIFFTTPNDGVSHVYTVHMEIDVTGPAPAHPWPTPTSGADGSYSGPWFLLDEEVDKYISSWITVGLGAYETSFAYLMQGESYGVDKYVTIPHDSHYPDYPITLLPNTPFKLQVAATNNILIPGGLRLGDYFDYSAALSISCADFAPPLVNIVDGIIEMN